MIAGSRSLGVALLVLACAPAEPEPAPSASSGEAASVVPCPATTPVRVTADSIGPFAADVPLEELRRLCPTVRDTFVLGDEVTRPALLLSLEGVQIWALQDSVVPHPDTGFDTPGALVLTEPASAWMVTGTAAALPLSLSMDAPFSRLREAYGKGFSFNEPTAAVVFCSLPGLTFFLDLNPSRMPRDPTALSQIPSSSRIRELMVSRDPWRLRRATTRCTD
jgi:hypothetical protein